jgi:hypothetical protein
LHVQPRRTRVCAAALAAFPKAIIPHDDGMAVVCEGLAERGNLGRVMEGDADNPDPDHDRVLGYMASTDPRLAMDHPVRQN